MSFYLGSHLVKEGACLAPMAGLSDAPFRLLCYEMGARYAVGEMLTCDSAMWNTKKSHHRLCFLNEEPIRSVQLLGNDVKKILLAAQYAKNIGINVLDFNMGCPAKKVCSKEAGAALMRVENEALAKKNIQALGAFSQEAAIPVTLKMRLGWDREHCNALSLVEEAQKAGFSMVVIHARTHEEGFEATPHYDLVEKIVQKVTIPIGINGGIFDKPSEEKARKDSNASFSMIARGALGKPWIFKEINEGVLLTEKEKKEVFKRHLTLQSAFYEPQEALLKFRKHLSFYAQSLFVNHFGIQEAMRATSLEDVKTFLEVE